jgi:hypothetical protein
MRWSWILFGLIASATAAQSANPITLKQAADMGLAMNGNGTSAWGPADEALSQNAQRSVAAIMKEADNRNREGDLALERACSVVDPKTTVVTRRAINLSDYASMMDVFKQADPLAPQGRMIAMNRMDGYSQGYEKGALEAWQLAFLASPELKQKICADVADLVRKRQ